MVRSDLVEWVKDAQARGYTPEQMREKLSDSGFAESDISEAMAASGSSPEQPEQPEQSSPSTSASHGGMFHKLKLLGRYPNQFYSEVQGEGLKEAFLQYTIILFVYLLIYAVGSIMLLIFAAAVLSSLLSASGVSPQTLAFSASLLGGFAIVFVAVISVISFVANLVFMFIWAAVVWVFAQIFGGEGRYADAFKAVAYPASFGLAISILIIPVYVLALIPVVGILISLILLPLFLILAIYWIILEILGISKLFNLSKIKAALAVLTPVVVLIVAYVVLIFLSIATNFRILS